MKQPQLQSPSPSAPQLNDIRSLRVVPGHPPELVVYDRTSNCPYLPGRPARLPLRLPARHLRADELDQRLAAGD
ncbi:MAG TPA: hypothetical protein VIV60_23725, partial [Polyangiaceae bacterium]